MYGFPKWTWLFPHDLDLSESSKKFRSPIRLVIWIWVWILFWLSYWLLNLVCLFVVVVNLNERKNPLLLFGPLTLWLQLRLESNPLAQVTGYMNELCMNKTLWLLNLFVAVSLDGRKNLTCCEPRVRSPESHAMRCCWRPPEITKIADPCSINWLKWKNEGDSLSRRWNPIPRAIWLHSKGLFVCIIIIILKNKSKQGEEGGAAQWTIACITNTQSLPRTLVVTTTTHLFSATRSLAHDIWLIFTMIMEPIKRREKLALS